MDFEKSNEPQGKLEALEAQTDRYLLEAPDQIFVEYLTNFKARIRGQRFQVELMQEELDRSYQMYRRRVELIPKAECKTVEHKTTVQELPILEPVKKKTSNAEFVIGTVILSVVGGAFILTALVMLSMYFMNGFMKGMSLYAVFLALILLSELLIHRKLPKLATVFSTIGIGGLYLSTVLNYLTLHNFGTLAAVVITLLITIFVIILNRRRDSFVYGILGLISSHLSFLTVRADISSMELMVLIGAIILMNIVYIVVSMQKHKITFCVMHMCISLIFAFAVDWRLEYCGVPVEFRVILTIGLLLIMQLLLIVSMRHYQTEESSNSKAGYKVLKVCYFICIVLHSNFLLGEIFWENTVDMGILEYGSIAAISVICIATMIALRKSMVKWYPYYLWNLACINICYCAEGIWPALICLMVLLVMVKLLSLWKVPTLKLLDAIITTISCIVLLGFIGEKDAYVSVAFAGVLLSVFFICQCQTYFEILLTYTLAFFISLQFGILQLPIFVGVLFIGILLFNNVSRFRGKRIIVYNIFVLVGEVVCFLLLVNPIYQNDYLTYLCMLVFGLATIVLTFQDKYHMNLRCKNMIMAIFLTYMALVVRTTLPIVNSILLMLIALICVGNGFIAKEKAIRIYGLVISFLVCGKIVLYDFGGGSPLQKTVLFFVVGVIVLIIAGIYIVLEKKNNKTKERWNGEATYEEKVYKNDNSWLDVNVNADRL